MPDLDSNPRTADDDSVFKGRNWFSRRINDFIFWWTPSCIAVTHLISEEMDHPLSVLTRCKMRVHFLGCCYCQRYRKDLRLLRALIRSLKDHLERVSGETLPPETKERIKRQLREEER